MPNFMIKRGDTWPPVRGLAAENELVIVGSVVASDTITLPGHGYLAADKVTLTAVNGGAPLVAGNLYYVVSPTLNTFKLALTSGGDPIDLTTDITSGQIKRLLPLSQAAGGIKVWLKSSAGTISGPATVIDPPIEDAGQLFNWKYLWAASDTNVAGDYATELEITWDSASTPAKKETVPNGSGPVVSIIADLG